MSRDGLLSENQTTGETERTSKREQEAVLQKTPEQQEAMTQKIQILNYKEKGYTFDPNIRQAILYYYHNMPEEQPPQELYRKIILIVQSF